MNKLILGMVCAVVTGISTITVTCPITLTNHTDTAVKLKTNDREPNGALPPKPTDHPVVRPNKEGELTLEPGDIGEFGTFAHHIEFTLSKQNQAGAFVPELTFKQNACAKKHVEFSVTDLLTNNVDTTRFYITKINQE